MWLMWLAISIVVLAAIEASVIVVSDELLKECPAESERKRSIGLCMLLSAITFGIYRIYWMLLLVKNTHSVQKNTKSCAGEMLCLIFVPGYSLYWWYAEGAKVKQYFSQYNYASIGNEIVYLILGIFGLDIVSMAIMQSDFNSLKSETISE